MSNIVPDTRVMYGRIFEGMFTGSMRGMGPLAFALWSYVIANMREDSEVGVQVELRSDLLAFYIGKVTQEDVDREIKIFCEPDPDSTCTEEEGRRLVQVGKFVYRVVSGAYYMKIRTEADLREYHRLAKRKQRERKKGGNAGLVAREIVNGKVRNDPITKADKAVMAKKWKASEKEPNAVEREYDLDEPI